MLSYTVRKRGTGEGRKKQATRQAINNVNKTGRSYNTTVRQAALNALLLTTNINSVGDREYIQSGSTMAENFEAIAGE